MVEYKLTLERIDPERPEDGHLKATMLFSQKEAERFYLGGMKLAGMQAEQMFKAMEDYLESLEEKAREDIKTIEREEEARRVSIAREAAERAFKKYPNVFSRLAKSDTRKPCGCDEHSGCPQCFTK